MNLSEAKWREVAQKFLKGTSIERAAKATGLTTNHCWRAIMEIQDAITLKIVKESALWEYNPTRENIWLAQHIQDNKIKRRLIVLLDSRITEDCCNNSISLGLLSDKQTKKYLSDKKISDWDIILSGNNHISLRVRIDDFLDQNDVDDHITNYYDSEEWDDDIDSFICDTMDDAIEDYKESFFESSSVKQFFKKYLINNPHVTADNLGNYIAESIWKFRNRGRTQAHKVEKIIQILKQNKLPQHKRSKKPIP